MPGGASGWSSFLLQLWGPSRLCLGGARRVVTLSGKPGTLRAREGDDTVATQPVRSQKLDVRLTPAAKETLQAAASAAHRSVSEFVLESALARAAETLADRRHFGLDAGRWASFIAALDAPPRDLPRVQRLFKERSIFDGPNS